MLFHRNRIAVGAKTFQIASQDILCHGDDFLQRLPLRMTARQRRERTRHSRLLPLAQYERVYVISRMIPSYHAMNFRQMTAMSFINAPTYGATYMVCRGANRAGRNLRLH